jgi:hypothetical protein
LTTDHCDCVPVELTLLQSLADDNGAGLVVESAWLPMVFWDGVRVVTNSTQGLTMMERFVIECLLTVKDCRAEELREIAAIPSELANWLLSSLVQKGLAQRRDGDWFTPAITACTQALERQSISISQVEQRGFIWFPETDEVATMSDIGNLCQQIRKLRPSGQCPLPDKWLNANRGQVIRNALATGLMIGDDVAAISDVLDDTKLKETCSAYHCNAVLPHHGTNGWRIAISGYQRPGRRPKSDTNTDKSDDLEYVERLLPLPVLPGLVSALKERLSRAVPVIRDNLNQKLGANDVAHDDGQLSATLDENAALSLSQDRLLVNRHALRVNIEGEIEYTIPLRLQPSPVDEAAQKLFSLDNAVQRVLAVPMAVGVVDSVCLDAKVSMSDLIGRLWQLKMFRKIYELREAEDFAG